MKPTSVIVVGGTVPASCSALPTLHLRTTAETDGHESLEACLFFLRNYYAEHQVIATLGGAAIILGVDAPPLAAEWLPKIEVKLCELLDDLGSCPLDSWKGALHVLQNGDRIASCPSSRELAGIHAGEPAIVLGSGPSASDYLDKIGSLRGGVRLFAADTILSGCLAAGITPDYVTAIERESAITRVLSDDAECGAILIASPYVEPECVQKWGKNTLFWWGGDDIFGWIDPEIPVISSGRSAGSLALAAALHAGCSPIYLIGHDLSYRNGQSHASDAHKIAHSANQIADATAHPCDPSRQRLQVPANGGGTVETNGLWCRIRGDIEAIAGNYPEAQIGNVCGSSGAVVAGIPPIALPASLPELASPPRIRPSCVRSPLSRCPALRASIAMLAENLAQAQCWLDTGRPLQDVSECLQISKLCGEQEAGFFHYITRSIYSALTLRLHYAASLGGDAEASHRAALRVTVLTLAALAQRMKDEIP